MRWVVVSIDALAAAAGYGWYVVWALKGRG